MTEENFLKLKLDDQNKILLKMANNVVYLLDDHNITSIISKRSLQICDEYLSGQFFPAEMVGLYLNHPDNDYFDLATQYHHLNGNETEISALNIVIYTTGSISRKAYLEQNKSAMPDPINLATPDNTVLAVAEYQALTDKALVPEID